MKVKNNKWTPKGSVSYLTPCASVPSVSSVLVIVSFHRLLAQFLLLFVIKLHGTETIDAYVIHCNSIEALLGNVRPISVIELIENSRNEARQNSANTIASNLRLDRCGR